MHTLCFVSFSFASHRTVPSFAVYRRDENSNPYVVRVSYGFRERIHQWKRIEEKGTILWSTTSNRLLSIVDITFSYLVESADNIVSIVPMTPHAPDRPLTTTNFATYKLLTSIIHVVQISNKTS